MNTPKISSIVYRIFMALSIILFIDIRQHSNSRFDDGPSDFTIFLGLPVVFILTLTLYLNLDPQWRRTKFLLWLFSMLMVFVSLMIVLLLIVYFSCNLILLFLLFVFFIFTFLSLLGLFIKQI